MREKLSSPERVRMAIEHQEPDRPPIQFYATPEIRERLTNHFKGQDLREMFDAVLRPRYQKFIDLAHRYGAKAWFHSCGSTYFLHSRFIDMGLDVLDAVQTEPANMDPERLKAQFGDKLTYCGMIDTQRLLPYGTVAKCRAVARHRIDIIGKGGGYIFCPSHDLQIDIPLENILAIYEEATGKNFM